MMRGIKLRAEGTWAPSAGDVLIPLSWFMGAATTGIFGARVVRDHKHRAVDAPLAGVSAIAVQVLLFWDLPARRRVALVLALGASTTITRRRN
jgi:hypothetical protein